MPNGRLHRPTHSHIFNGRSVHAGSQHAPAKEWESGSRQNWIYSAGYAIRATDVLRALPTLQLYSRSAGFIARAIGQFLAFGSVLIDEIQPDTFGRDWPASIGRNSCLCAFQPGQRNAAVNVEWKFVLTVVCKCKQERIVSNNYCARLRTIAGLVSEIDRAIHKCTLYI